MDVGLHRPLVRGLHDPLTVAALPCIRATMRAFYLALSLPLLVTACKKEEEKLPEVPVESALSLDAPAAGEWADAGAYTAMGRSTNLESVDVMGVGASLAESGDFDAGVELGRGINVVEARGLDTYGDTLFVRNGVLAGEFGDPDGAVEGALVVRVNRGGIDHICTLAEDLITADLMNDALAGMNPVYSDDILGIEVDVNLDHLDFAPSDIRIETGATTVTLVATLPNLDVDSTIYADIYGWETDFGVSLGASAAVVTAELVIGASDGDLQVTLQGATVELEDFWYDISFVPDAIDGVLLVETIRDTIQDMLVEKIQEMVPPLVDETLAGLDPSFSMDLMGRSVSMAFGFAGVRSDEDGLALTLDVDVDFPTSGDHTYAGYLLAGYGEPTVDTGADLGLAMSDDLLNRTLFEAWRSGILEMELSTEDGSLDGAMLAQFKADQGTIRTFASLPPVVVEKDGQLVAQVGELIVTVDTPGGELGEHLVAAVNAEVPLGMAIEDGALTLDVGEPVLTMMVRESDWGADEDTTTRLIESALPLDALLSLLGVLSFDLPTLYGIGFESGTASRDRDGVHTDAMIYLR